MKARSHFRPQTKSNFNFHFFNHSIHHLVLFSIEESERPVAVIREEEEGLSE